MLERSYQFTHSEVAAVEEILQTTLYVWTREEAFSAMASLKAGRGDFADALIGAINSQSGCSRTITFDRKALRLLARIADLARRNVVQRANRTVMCCPDGKWLPGRATARARRRGRRHRSELDCCAMTAVSGSPRNDGRPHAVYIEN